MSNPINNRYEFVLLFDVKDGNPNGDPDAGNLPRIDPETGNGLVTDVCLKRKVRNYVQVRQGDKPNFEIYVKEKAVLNSQHERAYDSLDESDAILKKVPDSCAKDDLNAVIEVVGAQYLKLRDSDKCLVLNPRATIAEMKKKCKADKKNKLNEEAVAFVKNLLDVAVDLEAQKWMCKNFFDVRTFGAVMSTGDWKCGQVRGPIQLGFARSKHPVLPAEHTITRMAVTTAKEAEKQKGDNRTMGRKFTIPYGLYEVHGFISAPLAKQTGFSEEDLELFWDALANMFDHDRSAARGEMAPQKLIVFKHDSELGNAPANKLFDLVTVEKNCGEAPPRTFSDYTVTVDKDNCPKGVTIEERI